MAVNFDRAVDLSNLKGRSAIVTGAASGIGLACATKLAEAGALVTVADVQEAVGQNAVQQLLSKGLQAQFVRCDVTSYQAQVEMFEKAIRFGNGKLDIVIPNAGVVAEANLFDMVPPEAPTLDSPPPPEPGFSGVHINLHGVYNTCYLAMHYFRLPRDASDDFKPSIVLIASLAGYVGYPSSSTYSISKFGVRGFFYGLRDRAVRCSPPVRVNLVAPWYIETGMTKNELFVQSEAAMLLNIIGFAPMERVVDAVARFSADQALHGRAVGVFPAANEDMGDELEGEYGGRTLSKHMTEVTKQVMKAMAEAQAKATSS